MRARPFLLMFLPALVAVSPAARVGAAAAADLAARPEGQQTKLLLGEAYPIEASVTFHAALLHWLDSIAALNGPGMTAGKTVEAHRQDYDDRLGALDDESVRELRSYAELRVGFAADHEGSAEALTAAFFETPTLNDALERAGALLDEQSQERLRAALNHFAPGYRLIWQSGESPQRFLRQALEAPERAELQDFLVALTRFYGVDEVTRPNPRLILAPVRSGHGTHAQTLGRNLLIEVRDGEGLADQVGPIVHENAHFLYRNIGSKRREALAARAARLSAAGPEAFRLLEEALPTALAQGLAEERFRPGWQAGSPWYHLPAVDRYAKRIFPLVKQALDERRTLDESLLRELIEAYRP